VQRILGVSLKGSAGCVVCVGAAYTTEKGGQPVQLDSPEAAVKIWESSKAKPETASDSMRITLHSSSTHLQIKFKRSSLSVSKEMGIADREDCRLGLYAHVEDRRDTLTFSETVLVLTKQNGTAAAKGRSPPAPRLSTRSSGRAPAASRRVREPESESSADEENKDSFSPASKRAKASRSPSAAAPTQSPQAAQQAARPSASVAANLRPREPEPEGFGGQGSPSPELARRPDPRQTGRDELQSLFDDNARAYKAACVRPRDSAARQHALETAHAAAAKMKEQAPGLAVRSRALPIFYKA